MWIKLLSLSVVFVSCLFIGKWWATGHVLVGERPIPSSEQHAQQEGVGPTVLTQVTSAPKAGVDEVALAWVKIKKFPKDSRLTKLHTILGRDPIGTNLYHTLLANSLEGTLEGSKEIREDGYKKAKQESKATMQKIKDAFAAMDSNSDAADKLRLLDLAANLEGVSDDMQELGLHVMQENIVPGRPDSQTAKTEAELNLALSTSLEMVVPVVGLALAIGSMKNSNQAFNITIDGIKNQPDKWVQQKMAEEFAQQFPNMAETLQEELKIAKIHVSITSEQDRSPSSEVE